MVQIKADEKNFNFEAEQTLRYSIPQARPSVTAHEEIRSRCDFGLRVYNEIVSISASTPPRIFGQQSSKEDLNDSKDCMERFSDKALNKRTIGFFGWLIRAVLRFM